MQRLQKILQNCHAEGALFLKLAPGSTPLVGFATDELYWNELGIIDINYFNFLQNKLIPFTAKSKYERNEFVVPSLGKISVIFLNDFKPCITLYLAGGITLFNRDWEKLQMEKAQRKTSGPTKLPPPPPVVTQKALEPVRPEFTADISVELTPETEAAVGKRSLDLNEIVLLNNHSQPIPNAHVTLVRGDDVGMEILLAAFDEILSKMQHIKATSLHIFPDQPCSFKVMGEILKDVTATVISKNDLQMLLDFMIPPNNRQQFLQDGAVQFIFTHKKMGRFRMHALATGENMVLTVRALANSILPFSELGLPDSLKNICNAEKGLVLIAGGRGQGKSTTMTAVIDYINRTLKKNIFTFEDCVEYAHVPKNCLLSQWPMQSLQTLTGGGKNILHKMEPDIVFFDELRTIAQLQLALDLCGARSLVFALVNQQTVGLTLSFLQSILDGETGSGMYQRLCQSLLMISHQHLEAKRENEFRARCGCVTIDEKMRTIMLEHGLLKLAAAIEKQDGKDITTSRVKAS